MRSASTVMAKPLGAPSCARAPGAPSDSPPPPPHTELRHCPAAAAPEGCDHSWGLCLKGLAFPLHFLSLRGDGRPHGILGMAGATPTHSSAGPDSQGGRGTIPSVSQSPHWEALAVPSVSLSFPLSLPPPGPACPLGSSCLALLISLDAPSQHHLGNRHPQPSRAPQGKSSGFLPWQKVLSSAFLRRSWARTSRSSDTLVTWRRAAECRAGQPELTCDLLKEQSRPPHLHPLPG